jgi:hypothetical protein
MKGKLQLNQVPKCEYLHAFLFFFTQPTFKHMSSATQKVITCLPPPYCCMHHSENYASSELLNKCHYVCAHEDDNKIRSQ